MYTDTNRGGGPVDPDRRDPVGAHETAETPAAAIGRELDTLLAIIQMNAQVGLEIGPPEMNDLFGDLMVACRRGVELSERLARKSADATSQRGPLDIAHLVEELRPVIEDLLGSTIRCDIADELAYSSIILAERDELEYVLFRVAVEARRAMRGGGALRIGLEDESTGHVRLVFEALEPNNTFGTNSFFSTEPLSFTPPGVACARRVVEQWGATVQRCERPGPAVALVFLRVAQRSTRPPMIISSDRIRSVGGRRASVESILHRSRSLLRQSRETLDRMQDACGRDAVDVLVAPERPLVDGDEQTCRDAVSPACSSTASTPIVLDP